MKYGIYFFIILLGLVGNFSLSAQSLSLSTFTTLPNSINETSGLAANGPNKVWTHNDSGGQNELYELDTLGNINRTLTITNASQIDWEELAQDDQGNFYIGDFGNNSNTRTNLKIYKIPNPDSIIGNSIQAEILNISYADQSGFPPPDNRKHYDMEAMIWYGGKLYLFSKNRTVPFDGFTRLYQLADTAGTYSLSPVDSFYTGPGPKETYWITAADISPSGQQLILLSYDKLWLFNCFNGDDFFNGNVQQIGLSALSQYEGIKFISESKAYLSNETSVIGLASLHKIDLSSFTAVPSIDLGPDINSLNTSELLDAGYTGSGSILWNTGATTSQINVSVNGTYWVDISEGNCTASDTIVVNFLCQTFASGISGTQIDCFGNANGAIDLTVVGGTPGYSYSWSNGASTQDLSGLGAGTYSVTIVDQNGCVRQQILTILEPPPLTLAANSNNLLCQGANNGLIDLSVMGGTPPYTYSWSNGDTTEDLLNVPAGTYSVLITDSANCQTQTSLTLLEPPALNLGVQAMATLCFGEASGSVDVSLSGGTPPYSYNWSNGDTTEDLLNVPAGTYSVTASDANGCLIQSSAQVDNAPPIGLATNFSNVSCPGLDDGSIDLMVVGGTPPYSYSWSNGDTTQDLNNLSTGTYTFFVSDINNCLRTDSVEISSSPVPQWILDYTDVVCAGDSNGTAMININGGIGPFSFLWSSGDTSVQLQQLGPGTLGVTITDALGCRFSDSVMIVEPPALLVSGQNTTPDSTGDSGTLIVTISGGTPPYQYSWSNGATDSSISGLAAGWYSLLLTDANACTLTDSFEVAFTAPADGLEALEGLRDLNIFPNPSRGIINIRLEWDQPQAVELRLYNLIGQQLKRRELPPNKLHQLSWNLNALSVGIYLLEIQSLQGLQIERVVLW